MGSGDRDQEACSRAKESALNSTTASSSCRSGTHSASCCRIGRPALRVGPGNPPAFAPVFIVRAYWGHLTSLRPRLVRKFLPDKWRTRRLVGCINREPVIVSRVRLVTVWGQRGVSPPVTRKPR
jgi:hypothetical protein